MLKQDMPRAARRILVAGLLTLAAPLALTTPAMAASGPASSPAAVILGSAPAHALAPSAASPATSNLPAAFDQRAQDLTDAPNSGDPTTCISRPIGLDGGTYNVQQFIRLNDNSGIVNNVPAMASTKVVNNTTVQNTWQWQDCLKPAAGGFGTYQIVTTLTDPEGQQQVIPSQFFEIQNPDDPALASWVRGSALQPGSDVH